MWRDFTKTFKNSGPAKTILVFLLLMTIWWLAIYFRHLKEGFENDVFTCLYFLSALWGGIWGLYYARYWGSFKSVLGRSLIAFSLGLLGQAFGQIFYNSYIYLLGIEVPYPSIGDIGFFSTWLFYAYGLALLARVSGAKISLKSFVSQIQAIVIPLSFLSIAYALFLRGYEFDWGNPIKIILDFGYPLGAAVYISFAILTYLLSRKALGGIMRFPIIFLIIALIFEALGDFTFNYQVSQETWYVGGTNDFLFLWAYSLMAIALVQLGVVFKRISKI
jgi:hypothetical protein